MKGLLSLRVTTPISATVEDAAATQVHLSFFLQKYYVFVFFFVMFVSFKNSRLESLVSNFLL